MLIHIGWCVQDKIRHIVLITMPSGNIREVYQVDDIGVLYDDLQFKYDIDESSVDYLINNGKLSINKTLFLYHKFEW